MAVSGTELQQEQADVMKRLSVSQPLLDDSDSFDIPSPPPLSENRFDSSLLLLDQLHTSASAVPEVTDGPRRAPIATIPELQLDYVDSAEDEKDDGGDAPPVHVTDAEAETSPDLDEPSGAATPELPATSDQGADDFYRLEPCKNNAPLADLSRHRPDEHDSDTPAASAPPHHASAFSRIQDSPPDPETNLTHATSSVVAANSVTPLPPADQDRVYGELCESLLPQSFTSEVLSSLSRPASKLYFETRQLGAGGLDESQLERDFVYSRLSSSQEPLAAAGSSYTPAVTSYSEPDYRYPTSSFHSRSAPSDDWDTLRFSAAKSDTFGVGSPPEAQLSTPPIPDYATSRGTPAQVTGSSRRAILVREFVTEEVSTLACSPSPVPEDANMERKSVSSFGVDLPGLTEAAVAADGLASPTYLSVGSDDGSAIEVYYSAEEDNGSYSGDEDIYSAADSEETYVGEAPAEPLRFPQEVEGTWRTWMGQREREGDDGSLTETAGGDRKQEAATSVPPPAGEGARSGEKGEPTVATWRVRGGGQEGTKAELLAAPVEQVSGAKVCELPPPTAEPPLQQQQEEERNWLTDFPHEDHSSGEQRVHPAGRDSWRSVYTTGEESAVASEPTEAGVRVPRREGGEEPAPLAASAEPQAATRCQDDSALQSSSEWAGPITQADRTGSVWRQVTFEPSAAQTCRPGDQLGAGGRGDIIEG